MVLKEYVRDLKGSLPHIRSPEGKKHFNEIRKAVQNVLKMGVTFKRIDDLRPANPYAHMVQTRYTSSLIPYIYDNHFTEVIHMRFIYNVNELFRKAAEAVAAHLQALQRSRQDDHLYEMFHSFFWQMIEQAKGLTAHVKRVVSDKRVPMGGHITPRKGADTLIGLFTYHMNMAMSYLRLDSEVLDETAMQMLGHMFKQSTGVVQMIHRNPIRMDIRDVTVHARESPLRSPPKSGSSRRGQYGSPLYGPEE